MVSDVPVVQDQYGATVSGTATYHRTSLLPLKAPPACRACGGLLERPFIDHGMQPIANGFHAPDVVDERRYRIQYAFCPSCSLVQLLEPPPFDALFTPAYPFLTGSSQGMVDYYADLAQTLKREWRRVGDPFSIVEVGCNDGTFLQHWRGHPHLGLEPSANVAQLARDKGCHVWTRPFNAEAACLMAATWGADDQRIQRHVGRNVGMVCAFHCLTHIPDLDAFFQGVDIILAPKGILVLEDPSLDVIVTNGELDQLYDEHAWVLSLPAIEKRLNRYGFQIIDCEPTPVHGGSMRLTVARTFAYPQSPRVAEVLQAQRYLTHPYTYRNFAEDVERKCRHLVELLTTLKANGHYLAAYGASSKLTVLLNRLGIGPERIDCVSDTTPNKIGTVVPGVGIPVVSREELETRMQRFVNTPYLLLGAWVHAKEIMAKERAFLERGGRFVVWNPSVRTLGKEDIDGRQEVDSERH